MTTLSHQIVLEEFLTRQPVEALAGVLDVEPPGCDFIPPLWHWLYLLEHRPSRDLGPDGHPVSGIPAPPGPGMRRMFAGGRVDIHQLLRPGEPATRKTWVVNTVEKAGTTGPLRFATIRHELVQNSAVAVVEEQDIVYRSTNIESPSPTADTSVLGDREAHLVLGVDERLLFRFSALTYNAHRIHYDRQWCYFEGYDDLVVHGPLQALMLGELYRRNGISLIGRRFSYRLTAPMIGPQMMHLVAAPEGLSHGAESYTADGHRTAVARVDDRILPND